MSPQPPQHSRSEDARYITRFVDHTQNIGSGRVPPSNTTAADGNVELVPVTTAVAARATAGGAAVPSFRDDQPLDMWLYEVGLDNLGNTCFMNSVLQCLLHVEPLVKFFLKMNIEPHLNLASPKKGALAVAFKQLVNSVYKRSAGTTGGSVSPANIQKAVSDACGLVSDIVQPHTPPLLSTGWNVRAVLDGLLSTRQPGVFKVSSGWHVGGFVSQTLRKVSNVNSATDGCHDGAYQLDESGPARQPRGHPSDTAGLGVFAQWGGLRAHHLYTEG
jgi:hypothetical protein